MKIILILSFFSFLLLKSHGQSFTNRSLEYWGTPSVCETNIPPDGWSNYSNVGLGPDEANFLICPTTIPSSAANGRVYARCLAGNPTTGEGMYQIVSGFTIGTPYLISYQFCGSNRWGGSGDCVWHLFIDDIDVNQSASFSSSDTTWQGNSYSFVATDTAHKIGVRAYTPTFNGGGSAAIDLFMINTQETTGIESAASESSFQIGPNPFENTLSITNTDPATTAQFLLFNITGQIVLQEEFSNTVTLHTEMLSPAVYFYQVKSNSKIIQQGKVIKK